MYFPYIYARLLFLLRFQLWEQRNIDFNNGESDIYTDLHTFLFLLKTRDLMLLFAFSRHLLSFPYIYRRNAISSGLLLKTRDFTSFTSQSQWIYRYQCLTTGLLVLVTPMLKREPLSYTSPLGVEGLCLTTKR